MAAGATSSTAAGEAEKLRRIAEERFLVGDVAGSLRLARKAEARCGSPEGFQALATYEVHAAAVNRNWYGVLGVVSHGGVTHENIKRRYRRLCLVLHPDKNRSAAAEGAFKLLQEACAVLSARHPPLPTDSAAEAEPCSAPSQSPRAPSTTAGSSSSASAEKSTNHIRQPPARRKPQRGAPPPRTLRIVYCGHCDLEFYAQEGEKHCVMCGEQLRESRRPTAAGKEKETPRNPWRENGSYSYPGQFPRCGARDVYKPFVVCALTWQLRCLCCQHHGPQKRRKDIS